MSLALVELSPARGGADALAAVNQLVLDALSSPPARYARALGLFRLVEGHDRPAIHADYRANLARGARDE